jgi:hypothetical protein
VSKVSFNSSVGVAKKTIRTLRSERCYGDVSILRFAIEVHEVWIQEMTVPKKNS